MNIKPDKISGSLRKLITFPNVLAVFFFLIILLTAGRYGFYGDELYYLACSKHLDWGYVDHPPLVAFLTFITTWIFGDNIIALRFMSGLAGAITVLLTVQIARFFNGGKLSQSFAALLICFASAFPALSSFLSMNPFDVMLCSLFIIVFLKTVTTPSPQKWIITGILFGVGLLNKYTFLVLGFSLLFSQILTKQWKVLKSGWLYISGSIAFVIFLPHILWQVQHNWPTFEFMQNATQFKNLSLSPVEFITQLIIGLNPFTFPLWLAGLLYLFIGKATRAYRFLGWMVIIFISIYMFQNSKFFYVLPVFPLLFGTGTVVLEQFIQRHHIRWLKWFIGFTVITSGIVLMPLAVPVLPVEQFVSYSKSLGLWNAVRMQKGEGDALPIHFVYRFGWEETVKSVNNAYNKLSPNEKNKCAVLASWYGIGGAIDHFGKKYGLPNAVCPNNSYWIWGIHNYSGEIVLAVGYSVDLLRKYFQTVEPSGRISIPYAYDVDIYLCRDPKSSLQQIWPHLKRFM